MTITVTVTHHDHEPAPQLRADVYHVDLYGQVSETPVRMHEISPGGSALVHLHRNNVLVVRELPQADDSDPADSDGADAPQERA